MMMPFHNAAFTSARRDRFALESIAASPSMQLRLADRKTVAFDTGHASVEVAVRSGAIWLTEKGVDRIVKLDCAVVCPPSSRVVLTALGDATLDVSVRREA